MIVEKINKITVIGAGYVGLVSAVCFAERGTVNIYQTREMDELGLNTTVL